MRVLHVGLGGPEIDKALRGLGHDVHRINWREIPSAQLIYLTKMVLKEAQSFLPDLVFMQIQTPGIVEARLVESLRQMGCVVINWTGDVRENIDWYLELGDAFNVTLFTNGTDIDKFKEKGLPADYLQIGYDPDVYYLDPRERRGEGVVFLGNNYRNRFPESARREEVVTQYREKGLRVFGGNWPRNKNGRTTPKTERIIYNTNCWALNLDHFDRPLFYSDRVIRAQACGAIICQMGETDITAEHPLSFIGYPGHWTEEMPNPKQVADYTYEYHRWAARIPRLLEIVEDYA